MQAKREPGLPFVRESGQQPCSQRQIRLGSVVEDMNQVASIPPPTAKEMRIIDAFMERFPESLRSKLTGSAHYKEGLLPLEDLQLMAMAIPPSPERAGDVDWLWYEKTYRGFPIQWRRAYDADPPVYDATLLIQVLSASLEKGECCVYGDPMTRDVFMNLLNYGQRSWQTDVLAAARWMPGMRAVHITEPGLDLLMRIVPLELRRALGMAGPQHDDSDDLLKYFSFEGRGMWVLQGYKEDAALFCVRDFANLCGVSKKQVSRILRERPDLIKGPTNAPCSPTWGVRRKQLRVPAGGPRETQELDKQELDKQEPPTPSGPTSEDLTAAVEASNQRAREIRLQRRAGGALATSFAAPSVGRTNEVSSSLPPSKSQKARRVKKPSPQALRREKESKEAFLKEAAPAFLAAKTKDEAVLYDPIPDIEKALAKHLRAEKAADKRRRKALARYEARLRAQELLS